MTDKNLVVCVDDDEAILTAVTRCLRSEPVEVRATLSAREALSWIVENEVAVLVSDYDMPEMSGAQLAGEVCRVRPETVRILLTGQNKLETAIDGLHQGEIFRFLTKPFENELLRQAVRAGVQRHRELVDLLGSRRQRERVEAIRNALEAEYPGISHVTRNRNEPHVVTDNPWRDAAELGIVGLSIGLDLKKKQPL